MTIRIRDPLAEIDEAQEELARKVDYVLVAEMVTRKIDWSWK